MKEVLVMVLVSVVWSLRPIGSNTVQLKTEATMMVPEEKKTNDVDELSPVDNNDTSPCDRYLRSTEVEVRSPRNHKFVTSNGWTERQRSRPEINVYSRVEEQPQPSAQPATSTFYQQQRDNQVYQHSHQQNLQPTVRTSKRIIYYATLPEVVRPPTGYQPSSYSSGYLSQPPSGYSGGYPVSQPVYSSKYPVPQSDYPGQLPAQLSAGYSGGSPSPPPVGYSGGLPAVYSGGPPTPSSTYLNGLPAQQSGYPNGLPALPSGYSGGYFTSQSGYSSDPYAIGPNSLSADFRQLESIRNSPDGLQRNRLALNENTYNRSGGAITSVTSKTTAVYKRRHDDPAEFRDSLYRPNEFTSKFASWVEPFYKSWSSSPWDKETTSFSNSKGPPSFTWDKEPLNEGGSWNVENPSWENKGSSWDKKLVEVPLKKPNNNFNSDRYHPEVAVVHSDVIDVRGDLQQNGSPSPPSLPSYEIIDADMNAYRQRQPQQSKATQNMHHDPPQSRTRYTPLQPPVLFEQQQPPRSSMLHEQQQPPSSVRYEQQNHNDFPSNGYYENMKNNINTHQFMTSWTKMSTQDVVSPTHSISVDSTMLGNSTNVQNNTRIIPYTNSTRTLAL